MVSADHNGVLTAKLLQVGLRRDRCSEASVKEVRLDSSDWENIRDLAMPQVFAVAEARGLASPNVTADANG